MGSSCYCFDRNCKIKVLDTVCCERNKGNNTERWHKKPKTAKIAKKHNGHTRGGFVLFILRKEVVI